MSMYISIGDAVIFTFLPIISGNILLITYGRLKVLPFYIIFITVTLTSQNPKIIYCCDYGLVVSEHSCQTDTSPTLTVSYFSYTTHQKFGIFFDDNKFHILNLFC